MKTKCVKKLLIASILSAACPIAAAAIGDKDNCNASNDVTGWGIWCGVDTYLLSQTENQPTAAGQETTTTPDVAVETLSNKDSELFGGKVAPSQNELSLTPTEGSTEFKGYWVSSTWNKASSSNNGNTETSTQGNDIGTIGVTLTDNSNDRVLQNFYDRNGKKTSQLDIEGYDSSSENNSDGTGSQTYKYYDHIANVNISDQNNQQSNAFAYKGSYETTITSNELSETYGIQSNNYKWTENKELKKITFNNEGELLKSYWSGQTVFESVTGTYQINQDGYSYSYDYNGIEYNSVYGRLTPLDEIQSMISGNLQARYTGNSALYQQDVTIDVDFGKESFSGNWTNGTNEAFDFRATGTIQGQHIVAKNITGGTGLVQGSFYGDQAKNLGGAYEVRNGVKTIRDVFATTQGANNSVNFKSNEY